MLCTLNLEIASLDEQERLRQVPSDRRARYDKEQTDDV